MSYEKNTWENGDIITAEKLNNLETGVANSDGVIFEFEAVKESQYVIYYESVDDAADIAAAFMQGKNVLLHLPAISGGFAYQEYYTKLIGYAPEATDGVDVYNEMFYIEGPTNFLNTHSSDPNTGKIANLNDVDVSDGGKLRIYLYVD